MLRKIPAGLTIIVILGGLVNLVGAGFGSLPAWMLLFLDTLGNFSAVFLGIFIEAAPFLLLGTLGSGFVEVFIDREDLARWMPRRTLPGVLAGGLIGLVFPVCECGVVPFTRRLMRKGVPVSVGITALLAAPVVNPIVIASTLAAFGPGLIFWGRIGLSFLIAVLTGLIFSLQRQSENLLHDGVLNPGEHPPVLSPENLIGTQVGVSGTVQKPSFRQRVRQALLVSVDEFFEMGRFLILGALLAALMQTFVRQPDLLSIGQGPVLSVLVLVALAVLLSICSTVDAFIALAFTGMFTNGAVLAFLVYGPMVDIKSTFMFLRVFKTRPVAYLVLIPLLLTLIGTISINYFGWGW